MRDVPEWVGENDDQSIPLRVRLRVFRAFGGVCQCGCGLRIRPGDRWDIEHEIAMCNGGEHREANLRPFRADHHPAKTRDDLAAKTKSDARARRHFGIKPQRKSRGGFMTNKNMPFKKTFNHGIIRRGGSRGR